MQNAKWRWRFPKCHAGHEKCNSSSENDAKILRRPHKMIFDTFADTWQCHEVPRLPRKTTLQLALTPWNRVGFAASHIDTARPKENPRLETRHIGASKRAFRVRPPPILTLCSLTIDVFLRVFLGTSKFAASKSMFRARHPSIFITSHKMPRPPRNLHLVATWRSPDNAIRKKHATWHV